MKLIIVESPTKAKTITKFLGKGFKVKSSFGHVRDLPKNGMGVDIENDFKPEYIIPDKARPKVAELLEFSEKADEIILASDEDREGEAISWHLVEALGLDKKNKKKYSRIVFHEITKNAIEKALENPRKIDLNLVDAQQARRVLDRLVGYELSPFLWKKIRRGLSAGRVQSVALRFIVEREREIQKFSSEEFWTIDAKLHPIKSPTSRGAEQFNGVKKKELDNEFNASLMQKNDEKIEQSVVLKLFAGDYKSKKSIITNKKSADEITEELRTAKYIVNSVEEKETLRNPSAPFTTSTLQQAAISNFGFSAKQTMMVAQKLYEEGYITYMRTDSMNLSLESLMSAQKVIEQEFGKKYSLKSPRYYKTKSKSAQEAHEAIRPTNLEKLPDELMPILEPNQYKLYRLIWNRTIACQMQSAKLNSVKADIEAEAGKNKYLLKANGSTIIFDGFLKVYAMRAANAELFLPPLKKGDELDVLDILPMQKFTAAPPRYNEATLVKVLEENGIGRPSTYAPTISTIIERKYVDKNEEKRLFPLEIGFPVNDLITENFPDIVSIDFTATIEKSFDEIAEGVKKWVPVIRDFYEPFHKLLEAKTKSVKKEDLLEKLDKKCPECGGDLVMKFGRFGKFIACSNYPTCKYTEKTDAEKKEDEESSGIVCDKCGAPMMVKRGRFGSFLGCSKYPECKNIMKIEQKTGLKCPKCQVGDVLARKSKKGKMFYGCNKYPDCDFVMWNKPTGELCPNCNQPLTFAAKGKIKCSNKDCGATFDAKE
jgi:DNA topoisomerase-1